MSGADAGWGFEMKWDGVRAIAQVQDGRVRLWSRNDIDMGVSYPELSGLGEALAGRSAVLDGEIVSFDTAGRPSFRRLQKRMHVSDQAAARRLADAEPVLLLLFDLLHLDGESLLRRPYTQRRAKLETLQLSRCGVADTADVHRPGHRSGRPEPGARSGRCPRQAAELDLPTRPAFTGLDQDQERPRPRGSHRRVEARQRAPRRHDRCATARPTRPGRPGLRGQGRHRLHRRDAARPGHRPGTAGHPASPFRTVPRPDTRQARWVRPELVGEVAFAEWTDDGRLRHPAWRGLRPDKNPDQVIRES